MDNEQELYNLLDKYYDNFGDVFPRMQYMMSPKELKGMFKIREEYSRIISSR